MNRQLSLVACYGTRTDARSSPFAACIEAAQVAVQAHAAGFQPYETGQVHGTLAGLEATPGGDGRWLNRNFLRLRDDARAMDIGGFLASLRQSAIWPMRIQVGGFGRQERPFTSRGRTPFERMVSIQGDKAVVMGWPVSNAGYPDLLQDLRLSAQRFGILHAWHRAPTDVDNDFYFRLGTFAEPIGQAHRDRVVAAVRRVLVQPTYLRVDLEDLYVVAYDDDTLPPATTHACRVTDPAIDDFVARTLHSG